MLGVQPILSWKQTIWRHQGPLQRRQQRHWERNIVVGNVVDSVMNVEDSVMDVEDNVADSVVDSVLGNVTESNTVTDSVTKLQVTP